MKTFLLFSVLFAFGASAQYTHPTTGIQSEYVGACLVTNCGPATYTDNGGANGNYSNGVAAYRTFCPSVAGNCMRVTFNSFWTEAGYDDLMVLNGPTQNSISFSGFPTTPSGYTWPHQNSLSGNLTGSTPFSFQSTDASGCLTFFFINDFSVSAPGWNATLQCVPCPGGPSGTSNSDCLFSTAICSNASITSTSTGPGIVSEGCSGTICPAGGENYSNWYRFVAQTTGTLGIRIQPAVPTDDYDFAIYGPNVSCGALGLPIRCSDSGEIGQTGATQTSGSELTENVLGDGFVRNLNVTAGESYYLVVDKWSSGVSQYTLSFEGDANLDCIILPVELALFEAEYDPNYNMVDLTWVTQTEINMSHYDVERSIDGEFYEVINRVQANGNTNMETQYIAIDNDPFSGVNYYRLKQFDRDGTFKYSEIRAVNVLDPAYDVITLFPNPTNDMTEVIFNSFSIETAQFILTDASGRTITIEPINVVKGGNRLDLDMSNQTEGVYMITIVTKHKTHRAKLVKQ